MAMAALCRPRRVLETRHRSQENRATPTMQSNGGGGGGKGGGGYQKKYFSSLGQWKCLINTSKHVRPKKKIVMLPSPDQNLKIGSVGRDFFFFFFFFWGTVRELSFPIFFLKFLNGEELGQNAKVTNAYTSHVNSSFIIFFLWTDESFESKRKW